MKDKFTNEQIDEIKNWINNGHNLAEIQNNIDAKFGLKITYIETRFLLDDLNIKIKSSQPTEENNDGKTNASDTDKVSTENETEEVIQPDEVINDNEGNSVTIEVDQITKPGVIAGGTATFKGNKKAQWYIDQMGRMGLVPEDESFKPNPQELQEMQMALQKKLQGGGI